MENSKTYALIQESITDAMIAGDTVQRDCLRMVVSDIKNKTVNAGIELTEKIVVDCVKKAVKQHEESIAQFEKAGRVDLSEKEKKELLYLEKFMPKMAGEAEVREQIQYIVDVEGVELVKKNFGLFMKKFSPDVDRRMASGILNSMMQS